MSRFWLLRTEFASCGTVSTSNDIYDDNDDDGREEQGDLFPICGGSLGYVLPIITWPYPSTTSVIISIHVLVRFSQRVKTQ